MLGKPHKPTSSARAMTEEELEIAQWRIEQTDPGEWKIDEIYGDVWADLSDGKAFGGVFKKAVMKRELQNIKLKIENGHEILASDRQLLYLVKLP